MPLHVLHVAGADVPITSLTLLLASAILLLPFLVWKYVLQDEQPYPGIPMLDTKEEGEKTNSEAKKRYLLKAKEILHQGMAQVSLAPHCDADHLMMAHSDSSSTGGLFRSLVAMVPLSSFPQLLPTKSGTIPGCQ